MLPLLVGPSAMPEEDKAVPDPIDEVVSDDIPEAEIASDEPASSDEGEDKPAEKAS